MPPSHDAPGLSRLGRLGIGWTLTIALGALAAVALTIALVTRYQLGYRVHDYAILNLAGQMRELSASMTLDAQQLLAADPAQASPAELGRYRDRLSVEVAQFDRIVSSFVTRTLPPDLTGLDAPVSCTWDALSLAQLDRTAAAWFALREQVAPLLAPERGREGLVAAAAAVGRDGPDLLESSRALSLSFKTMMQKKLDNALRAQGLGIAATLAVGLAVVLWVRRRITQPIAQAEQHALRLLEGDLGAQNSIRGGREVDAVGAVLNRLSAKLRFMVDLSQHAGSGLTLSEVLQAVHRDMARVLPVDVMGVAVSAPEAPRQWQMLRMSGPQSPLLGEQMVVEADDAAAAAQVFRHAARDAGFGACEVSDLGRGAFGSALLLMAARTPAAFGRDAAPVVRSVAAAVRSQFDRTVATEALVVAAVQGLAKLAESRDPETGDHLLRMSTYAAMIATELGREGPYRSQVDARFIEDVLRFAPMHDIGKVGIADAILRKPGRLTDDERQEMSRHPTIGAEVLRRCEAQIARFGRTVFRVGIEIAEGHHEKWDGSGYPQGLAGAAIPLSARIVAVADVFDALTSRRPYKEAWSVERALATIEADSGRHFDPVVVAALHRALPRLLPFYEVHKHV